MKKNLEILIELVGLFGENDFYANSYSEIGITLQGHISASTIKNAIENGFQQKPISEDGYLSFEKENITINLT
jgi:hypothetical protein